jgi:hypothetical protein
MRNTALSTVRGCWDERTILHCKIPGRSGQGDSIARRSGAKPHPSAPVSGEKALAEVLLQKIWREGDGREAFFLASFTLPLETAGDACNLTDDVAFFDATYLPFPYHTHDLIALEGSLGGFR